MASITPKNGRVAFLALHSPHTYWELNSTNLGTNYGDDTSGNDDNTNVASGDISTQESYEGMNSQNDPPQNGWFDIYTVTDAAALVYIPAGLTHGTNYGLFHNGGGTNAQSGWLRATTTGVEVGISHNANGANLDSLVYEIPDADLGGWFTLGFQFASEGGAQGDMGLWVNGTKVRSGTRNYQLLYGSGNPDFGNSGGREITEASVLDPPSYSGGDWAGNTAINGSGILIANFCCDNPNQTNSSPPGNGDDFYTDYHDEHTESSTPATITPTAVAGTTTAPSPTILASAGVSPTAVQGQTVIPSPTVGTGSGTTTPVAEVSITSAGDPESDANHRLGVIARNAGAGTVNLTVWLVQGTTVIASLNESTISGSWTTYEYELSAGEAASITDYGDLRIRWQGEGTGANDLKIDAVWLDIPDPGGVVVTSVTGTATIPSPIVVAGTGTSIAPTTVVGTASLPSPDLDVATTVTPVSVVGVGSVPSPTIFVGATIAPSPVTGTATIPSPSVEGGTGLTLTPTAVEGVATTPAPTITVGTSIGVTGVVGQASVPSPTVTTGADVTPTAVVGSATIPQPTVVPQTSIAPSSVVGTTTIPQPTITAITAIAPVAVVGSSTIPSPTFASDDTAVPSSVVGSASIPSPTLTATATVTPAAVVGTTTIPSPSITSGGGVTLIPSSVVGAVTIPQPTISTGVTLAPSVVTGSATIPSQSVTSDADIDPDAVEGVASIPSPSVSGQANATVTPNVVVGVAAVPNPTISTVVAIAPSPVAGATTIPSPTITAGATITPTVVVGTTSIGEAGVNNIFPPVVVGEATIPIPTITAGGEFTGWGIPYA